MPAKGFLIGTAIDPEDRIYVSLTSGYDLFATVPELPNPDQIYQFTSEGEFLGQFPPDPAPDPPFFQTGGLAADHHGVYVLLKEPVSFTTGRLDEINSYVTFGAS